MAEESHWVRWHRYYDDPESSVSQRLAVVKRTLEAALTSDDSDEIRVVSLCAGRGRDVLDVLRDHPRASHIGACLVEADPALAADAAQGAASLEAGTVDVRCADAALVDNYSDWLPCNILLACGIFGNITEHDIRRTIEVFPSLLKPSGTVIWTRHRRPPDLTPTIRGWFNESGFVELSFEGAGERMFGVGAHRLSVGPPSAVSNQPMFTFIGDGVDAHR